MNWMLRAMLWLALPGWALLAGCQKAPQSEPPANPQSEKPAAQTTESATGNPRFYTVQKQLDPGGSMYLYLDVKDFARDTITAIKELVPQLGLPPAAAGTVNTVLDEIGRTGINGISDVGMSSYPEGEFFRNKIFLGMPGGPTGLLALTGKAPHPIAGLDYAAADTALFASYDFDAAGLLAYIREAAKNVGGQVALESMNQKLLALKTQTHVDIEAAIQSLAGNFTVVSALDPAQQIQIPRASGDPVRLDLPCLALIIDTKDATAYEALHTLLAAQGLAGDEATTDALRGFALQVPPNPVWPVDPLLASDGKRLILATHAAYLNQVLATQQKGGGLARSAEFKRLGAGLPSEGNSLLFVSDKLMKTYHETMNALGATEVGPLHAVQEFVRKQFSSTRGCFSISASQPDGVLIASRSTQGVRQFVGAAGVVAMLPTVAMATLSSHREGVPQPENTVVRTQSDLRSMATALEAYYIDNAVYPPTGATWHLTTPVAYITQEMPDLFLPQPRPFAYYNADQNGWILWSAGPDGTYDIQPNLVMSIYKPQAGMGNFQASPELIQLTYDPTNGTKSPGDIWRIKQ